MSFPSSFGTQVAAILDVLAKAAVAEITKLVEDGSVVLRLEMCRKQSEIQELRRGLQLMEAELCRAREAATTRSTEEQTTADKSDDQKTSVAHFRPKTADSPREPQTGTDESLNVVLRVKQEPLYELATGETTYDAEMTGNDSIWPPPACSTLEKSSVALQQHAQILTSQSEQYSSHGNSDESYKSVPRAAREAATDCLSVPIKVEVEVPPVCMGDTTTDSIVHNEQFRRVLCPVVKQDECLQSASQQAGPSLVISNVQGSPAGLFASNAQDHTHPRHGVRAKRPTIVRRTNQKVFTCYVCNKGFPRASQLEEHRATHQASKPFRCLECGKSFTQKTRLKTHQSVHTGERPFGCTICGKTFSRHDNCLRHERFHSGQKPYSCRQCGKNFAALGNLRMHQGIHLHGK
ncbi:zinc finger and SCAN domain-containing protein 12-like [Mugil cephalus]|uniref:zinc finger and SCAN domain-containing protein 12-like n=1 Tax=Mugil cephalus TaxID=48193 RepID=UPI001FB6E7F5|nr:zinc finger and SCAN domain-containing protein 12-like [Mugil cephalus]